MLRLTAIAVVAVGLLPKRTEAQAPATGYRIDPVQVLPLYNTGSPSAWAAANNASVPWCSGGSVRVSQSPDPSAIKYPASLLSGGNTVPEFKLVESAFGQPVEHIQPSFYLGDSIEPLPSFSGSDVDWAATLAANGNFAAHPALYYEPSVHTLYAVGGDEVQVVWKYQDGTTRSEVLIISGAPKTRPYRIYWTETPYNAPAVDLSGMFVKFHWTADVPESELDTRVEDSMVVTEHSDGLAIDPDTGLLRVYGEIQGMIVMQYFKTGSFDEQVSGGVIVVQVLEPEKRTLNGFDIGDRLLPDGRGHGIAGLVPRITAGLGGAAPFVYQHSGNHSYSPKNGWVYAIRKTLEQPWKIEIYWEDEDLMGTQWPFEVDWYECGWPTDAQVYVRADGAAADANEEDPWGAPVVIPTSLHAQVMEFQEPAGHARVTQENMFETRQTQGDCLLMLTGDDNVWFQAIRSVPNNDPGFDITPIPWTIGDEVRPHPTSAALTFDGVDDYLEFGSFEMDFSAGITIEAWVYYEAFDQWSRIMDFGNGSGIDNIILANFSTNGDLVLAVDNTPSDFSLTAAGVLKLNRWTHVAATVTPTGANSAVARIYVDGIKVAENSSFQVPVKVERTQNYIGRSNWAADGYFKGRIDEFRLYNRALGDNEIAADWGHYLLPPRSTDLQIYLPVQGVEAGHAVDATGNFAIDTHGCGVIEPGAVGMPDREGFSEYHGYIHKGTAYNVNLYRDPHQIEKDMQENPTGQTDPGDDDPANVRAPDETYIFGVNDVDGDPDTSNDSQLEVWWSGKIQQEDMPDPVWIPAWVQVFENGWAPHYAEIVLASQRGSAGASSIPLGYGVDCLPSRDSFVRMPAGSYVSGDFSLELWVKPRALQAGACLVNLSAAANGGAVSLELSSNNASVLRLVTWNAAGTSSTACAATAIIPTDRWTHIAGTLAGTTATIYVNGQQAAEQTHMIAPIDMPRDDCRIGGAPTGNTWNGFIDNVRIWQVARTASNIASMMYQPLTGDEENLVVAYPFAEGMGDTTLGLGLSDLSVLVNADWADPGAPQDSGGVIVCNTAPIVYTQNDPSEPGYKPNAEHAFVRSADGGYITYALRDDLVDTPHVLIQYQDPDDADRPKMRVYRVARTSTAFPEFTYPTLAGLVFPGPHPLDLLTDPWTDRTTCVEGSEKHAWRDRKRVWWARSGPNDDAASVDVGMRYWYPMQDEFDFPDIPSDSQPVAGTPIPWLPGGDLTGTDYTDKLNTIRTSPLWNKTTWSATKLKEQKLLPMTVTWEVSWPTDVPEMYIGETLIEPRNGLPDIWNQLSVDVLYQQSIAADDEDAPSVRLIDPIQTRRVALKIGNKTGSEALSELGFTVGPNGNTHNYRGLTYFYGLAPDLSSRFYFDPNAGADSVLGCLSLDGQYVEHASGVNYLLVNVLTAAQRDELKALVSGSEHKDAWDGLIDALPGAADIVNADPDEPDTPTSYPEYSAVSHYALTTVGSGTGYVTVIFNDALPATDPEFDAEEDVNMGVHSGDPITMQIIKVLPRLARNSVIPIEDSFNLLSDQMNLMFSEAFAGKAGDYEFEWRYSEPNLDGTTPTDPDAYLGYGATTEALTRLRIGGQGSTLEDMVNRFFIVRYRATADAAAHAITGDIWSEWTEPMLAQGWVQRVLNAITPFEQRLTDLYTNPPETMISMLEEAGPPYEGDVALNMSNIENVGLIQLYQTVLNRAESLSLLLGTDSPAANQQLLLAATRLNDLYMLLGNEAYADALDPTVSFGSSTVIDNGAVLSLDYGAYASSLFCFDNQVSTLLEEELCLLRGRNSLLSPGIDKSPYFNRLVWNFTKGITAGEVAYAMHYNVKGSAQANINEDTAAEQYPQGHGDAWGHYLCALKSYYRLLKHPNYTWGDPAITPMLVGGRVVDVDYYDEERFADTAAALVRTGTEIVDRTCRQVYTDNGTDAPSPGYRDADSNRAWGVGDWGTRTGTAALYNWACAASLLPPASDSAHDAYTNPDIRHIDRDTVPALREIIEDYRVVQRRIDAADGGFNPLGLADGAVPFDISPAEVDAGKTHFEQISERAATALANAAGVFDRVQDAALQLRRQQESMYHFELAVEQDESANRAKLIEIFGYPYSDDIGPGATYPQGYDGPDLYHYMYIDMESLGLEEVEAIEQEIHLEHTAGLFGLGEDDEVTFVYSVAPSGMPVKPHNWSGRRRAEGKVQAAYRSFLTAYCNYEKALDDSTGTLEGLESEYGYFVTKSILKGLTGVLGAVTAEHAAKEVIEKQKKLLESIQTTAESMYLQADTAAFTTFAAPFITMAGMSVGFDPGSALRAAALGGAAGSKEIATEMATAAVEGRMALGSVVSSLELWVKLLEITTEYELEMQEHVIKLQEIAHDATIKAMATRSAFNAMVAAQEAFITVIADGEMVLERHEGQRKRVSNRISSARYTDMAFRIFRNDALQRYTSAFDLAAKYTYLAAKAYDYETGLLASESAQTPGCAFLEDIVKARTIGRIIDGVPQLGGSAGEPGLADALARMNANWSVLKGRFGFNNPSAETGRFSLRTELFRFFADERGDTNWERKLSECRVDNLLDLPEFRRYCLPFASEDGLEEREPGFVIEFSSTIDFAKNFFGRDLLGGDNAYDSSHFATKVRGVGVWFSNYDRNRDGDGSGPLVGLANQPRVYLVPIGVDTMRSPSSIDGATRSWTIMDQTIPLPYALSNSELDDPDFMPLFDSFAPDSGLAKLRRYPSLRAYHDNGFNESEVILNSRLVGRSVWNSKWLLIIPAGTLHSDRDQALDWFIHGVDYDGNGVKDIKLIFTTYSYAGN